jgi:metallopeptidase MepB
VSRLYSTVR